MIVFNLDQMAELVAAYMEFDEFVFDVETMGDTRGDPRLNKVFWISLAGPGRADAIPFGHPIGEITKEADKYTDRWKDPETNRWRTKVVHVPAEFSAPPKQLYPAEVFSALRPLFFSNRRKIGQGVKFDLVSVAKYFKAVPPAPYGDTITAAHLINENRKSKRLGDLVKEEFDFAYDKLIGKEVEKHPFSVAANYAILDSKYTWLLWRKYKPQLIKEGFWNGSFTHSL
jgi:hypothetical protein